MAECGAALKDMQDGKARYRIVLDAEKRVYFPSPSSDTAQLGPVDVGSPLRLSSVESAVESAIPRPMYRSLPETCTMQRQI